MLLLQPSQSIGKSNTAGIEELEALAMAHIPTIWTQKLVAY